MTRAAYDYVIVGGGSAGCVLAGRLSEDRDVRVLLLEAGPKGNTPIVNIPAGMADVMKSKVLNWAYSTVPQRHLNGRRLFTPRGRMLGGSSGANAMIYIRGHAEDYNEWADLGCTGWDWASVLPLFRRAEHNERFTGPLHGTGGPLNVADLRFRNPLAEMFVTAAEALGHTRTDDFNGAEQDGFGFYQVTQKNGERWSAARAYLTPEVQARPNLKIVTGAVATRLGIVGGRAETVEFVRDGRPETVRAEREILLCGGAINSPHLMLLSGIGPGDEIRRQGLPVVHELPGVGQNLQDHLDIRPMYLESTRNSFCWHWSIYPRLVAEIVRYLGTKRGLLTSNFAEAGGFVRSDAAMQRPDLQFHFLPCLIEDHGRVDMKVYGFSIHVCQLRPVSRGRIGLESADPLAAPLIDPNYLDAPEDRVALRTGLKMSRDIANTAPLSAVNMGELVPGVDTRSDTDLDAAVRQHTETVYHPVGTCKMGVDAMAVVDPALRVHGLTGLRVVDASIMPKIIGGNTNAPTIMIAEKAADLIRGQRNLRDDVPAAAE